MFKICFQLKRLTIYDYAMPWNLCSIYLFSFSTDTEHHLGPKYSYIVYRIANWKCILYIHKKTILTFSILQEF